MAARAARADGSSGAEAGGFDRSRAGLAAPDLQIGPLPGPAPDPALTLPTERRIALITIAIDVRSRGALTLRSGDPFDAPLIDPRYLTEQADVDMLVAGIRLARGIAASEPLASITAGEHAPGDAELADLDPRERRHGVPSDQHVRDGSRARTPVRSRAARARCGRAARGRRLGHAGGPAREHERADDRDRRARGRPHPWSGNTPAIARYSAGGAPYCARNSRLKCAAFVRPQRIAIELTGSA